VPNVVRPSLSPSFSLAPPTWSHFISPLRGTPSSVLAFFLCGLYFFLTSWGSFFFLHISRTCAHEVFAQGSWLTRFRSVGFFLPAGVTRPVTCDASRVLRYQSVVPSALFRSLVCSSYSLAQFPIYHAVFLISPFFDCNCSPFLAVFLSLTYAHEEAAACPWKFGPKRRQYLLLGVVPLSSCPSSRTLGLPFVDPNIHVLQVPLACWLRQTSHFCSFSASPVCPP